ncbi:MAG TPA: hypothetical protein VGN59_06840 [Acidimicrobiia bacterium]|jgi:hypothetical protein
MNDAVEEILRRVTPISHFNRTATEDTQVRGGYVARVELETIFRTCSPASSGSRSPAR